MMITGRELSSLSIHLFTSLWIGDNNTSTWETTQIRNSTGKSLVAPNSLSNGSSKQCFKNKMFDKCIAGMLGIWSKPYWVSCDCLMLFHSLCHFDSYLTDEQISV